MKKTHKEWRKEAKKLRRKRIRQQLAEERNKIAATEEASRLKDPVYQAWLKEQEDFHAVQLEQEERHRQEQEELWLRRELLADIKFREHQRRQEATQAAKEAERQHIQKEFEEIQKKAQKKREERLQREEQAKKEHKQMLDRIAVYIELGGSIPEELKSTVESNPSKELCPFFSKTNACRFGMHCCRNHIRPKLSRILFFPNFFSHIKLEQSQNTEYGCDINLECTDGELNADYEEFFNDVVEELRKFGKLVNFRTCMNAFAHLRGNVFAEYAEERDALKAYMQLQGRYYASRRINVEFSPIVSWRIAICGLTYSNKCPKGKSCNFLHIFKNPGNAYNQREIITNAGFQTRREDSVISWNDGDERSLKRNWRWSESPEGDCIKKSNGDEKSNRKSSNRRNDSSTLSSRRSRSKSRNSKSGSHSRDISNRSRHSRSNERSTKHNYSSQEVHYRSKWRRSHDSSPKGTSKSIDRTSQCKIRPTRRDSPKNHKQTESSSKHKIASPSEQSQKHDKKSKYKKDKSPTSDKQSRSKRSRSNEGTSAPKCTILSKDSHKNKSSSEAQSISKGLKERHKRKSKASRKRSHKNKSHENKE